MIADPKPAWETVAKIAATDTKKAYSPYADVVYILLTIGVVKRPITWPSAVPDMSTRTAETNLFARIF